MAANSAGMSQRHERNRHQRRGHREHDVFDQQQPQDSTRLAPRARRSAISPRREMPRASTRAVMLAQTISSSSAPIALSTMTAGSM